MSNLTYINNIIDKRYDTYEVLKRKYGVVKKVINESKAVVTIEDNNMIYWQNEYKRRDKERKEAEERGEEPPVYNNDGTRDLTLLNVTGENLLVGDGVWVYYWADLASGYIAVRIGLSNNAIEMPPLYVGKLGVYNSEQTEYYMPPHDYYGERFIIDYEKRLVNNDEKNGVEIHQGESHYGFNTFFVNGFPCIVMPHNHGQLYSTWHNILIRVNPHLFSQEIRLKIYDKGSIGNSPQINPDVESTISIELEHIGSIINSPTVLKKYEYVNIVSYKDIEMSINITPLNEQTLIPYSSTFLRFNSVQEMNAKNINLILAIESETGYYRVQPPTLMFPYGSINVIFLLRYTDGEGSSSYYRTGFPSGAHAGFASMAEYEFAKCVIERYNVVQEIIQGG